MIASTDTATTCRADVSDATESVAWNTYVASHPDATAYHNWHWRDVFHGAFGHECVYLEAHREDSVVGVLPLVFFSSRLFGRFLVSLPFVNYGGVLADDDGVAASLIERAEQCARERRAAHVELRHRRQRFPHLPSKRHKAAMLMPLAATEDQAWHNLDRKVRNQIRKAEKSGLSVIVGGSELLPAFYRVFAENMRDLGTPVYAYAFFDRIVAVLGGHAQVVLVHANGMPVAGGIALTHRDVIEVPWAASRAAHRTSCPNHLLYWTVIRYAIQSGLRTLDFGRSTPNEGTFHFKRQWGAEPEPLCWEYQLLTRKTMPDQSPTNSMFRPAITVWKRLPIAAATLLGPRIVRSIP